MWIASDIYQFYHLSYSRETWKLFESQKDFFFFVERENQGTFFFLQNMDMISMAREYVSYHDENDPRALKVARKIYNLSQYTLHGIEPQEDDQDNWGSGYGKNTETTTFIVPESLRKGLPSPSVKGGRRRNRPGTKGSALSSCFSDAESLREKLHCLVLQDPSDVKRICALPKDADLTRWIYEHLRRFVLELNKLVVALRRAEPKYRCTSVTCPDMIATEKYTFRCAGPNGAFQCCAIEYMTHTLDSAAATLSNPSSFPTNDRAVVSKSSLNACRSQARRLYRLFPHAYFHHREVFQKFEDETYLLRRFLEFARSTRFVSEKQLIPRINI